MKTFHVYILASKSRVLYVGVTSDLLRRMYQHRAHSIPGFTSRYLVDRLVHFPGHGRRLHGHRTREGDQGMAAIEEDRADRAVEPDMV